MNPAILDGRIKYGSRVLQIGGVDYVAERINVLLDSHPMYGNAELQFVNARPYRGDRLSTEIEGKEIAFQIEGVELIERMDYYNLIRCTFKEML